MEVIGGPVLVIDEVHNILAGTYRGQRIVLTTLRFLSNRLQISLVCLGVNEVWEAISGDVQLTRRFASIFYMINNSRRRQRERPRANHRRSGRKLVAGVRCRGRQSASGH
ncbi:TniB family NTP-binding protein [Mesorhizobium sp. M0976]|uniref:TniB family NTP-binding protein n=1 Tax=Mesorhizobium sp. M0976 TaxID=2957038 RepID=UPI00333AFE68